MSNGEEWQGGLLSIFLHLSEQRLSQIASHSESDNSAVKWRGVVWGSQLMTSSSGCGDMMSTFLATGLFPPCIALASQLVTWEKQAGGARCSNRCQTLRTQHL